MPSLDSQLAAVSHLTILGTGLLGGSIGLGLRAQGYQGRLIGGGPRRQTLEQALARGCVDEAYDLDNLGSALAQSTLVILAGPLGSFASLFGLVAAHVSPHAIITDVGSTKAFVRDLAQRLLPDPSRFVGSHPMAGGERHGPQHARPDLFQSKPCIITPEPQTSPRAVELVRGLWTTLGMNLVRMTADDHDRQVARVSHLPHALAATLARLARRQGGLEIASTGFGDTTRIAGSDPKLWVDIFTTNRAAVLDALDAFALDLTQLRAMLASGDDAKLLEFLQTARHARDEWTQRQSAGHNTQEQTHEP